MSDSISRRDFLHVTPAPARSARSGSLPASRRAQQPAASRRPDRPSDTGWFDRPMRWVQLTLVENDPGRFDPQFWLDYFRAPARRRRDAERRRHRRLLPDQGAAAPSQRVARRHRSVRHAGRRLPRAGHARRRADRSACGARRRSGGASGLDFGRRQRRAAAPLGQSRAVGHVRARSLQLRLHGPGATARSCPRTTSTASSRIAGRRRAATATACTASGTSRTATGRDLPRTTDRTRSRAPRVPRVAQERG